MDNLSFLEKRSPGGLRIVISSDGPAPVFTFSGVDIDVVSREAPRLAQQIRYSDYDSHPPLIEFDSDCSIAAVVGLFRYLYKHDYAHSIHALRTQPNSLLLHFQMYKMGVRYDISGIRAQSIEYALRAIHLCGDSPNPVIDLSDAIRFLVLELPDDQELLDMLTNYCLAYFYLHRLSKNPAFRQTIFEAPRFHQALCHANMRCGFPVPELMVMDVCPNAKHMSCSSEIRRATDFMCYLHSDQVNRPSSNAALDLWHEPSLPSLSDLTDFLTKLPNQRLRANTPQFFTNNTDLIQLSDPDADHAPDSHAPDAAAPALALDAAAPAIAPDADADAPDAAAHTLTYDSDVDMDTEYRESRRDFADSRNRLVVTNFSDAELEEQHRVSSGRPAAHATETSLPIRPRVPSGPDAIERAVDIAHDAVMRLIPAEANEAFDSPSNPESPIDPGWTYIQNAIPQSSPSASGGTYFSTSDIDDPKPEDEGYSKSKAKGKARADPDSGTDSEWEKL